MEKKIIITRVLHRNEWRYCIYFGYDEQLASEARNIKGAAWSNTLRCWHVPENEESLKTILSVFNGKADIDISTISTAKDVKKVELSHEVPGIRPERQTPGIQEKGVHAQPDLQAKKKIAHQFSGPGGYGPVRFSIRSNDGMFTIKFLGRYNPQWIDEMKTYGRIIFDKSRKEWILQWSQITVDSLSDYFSGNGVKVEIERHEVSARVKQAREELGEKIRSQELNGEAQSGIENVRRYLVEKRYSVKTIESYLSQLAIFFRYFHDRGPCDITTEDITDFFNDYVVFNKYSASYQNQMVSAIKIYYMLNGEGKVDIFMLSRPRRVRALPKVFSKDEVKQILNSPRNVKHRLLLWMIYSCGLRRGEAINIKLDDLDRERSILNIREGKGKVDRIVPVSEKVWEKIDEYRDLYNPGVWLFEGQGGRKYSTESVYNVFKQALKMAGIKKEVGVHSLRHSYATHLHESGLDIRYIQELLGHKSTKTTEIYTHVSRRNLISVRSPIEDLDLK